MAKKKSTTKPDSLLNTNMDNMGAATMPERMDNGLGESVGFNAFNMPVGPGAFPGTEQISNVNTIFKNLRWFLVSNFRQVLSELYVEIGLVQVIVDVPVDDALRGGVEIHSKQLDEDQIKELQISLDRDNDIQTVAQAAKWNRLFGGAGNIILTDQDPEEPLDLNLITADSALEFRAVDMWELFWDKQNTEGYDPSIQSNDFEYYNYYGENLHKSRVMRMKGLEAPSFIRPRLRGWGFSVVEILIRSINQYLKATDLGFEVLDEFKLDVYKIKNLVNTLLAPNGQQKIQQRVQLANWQKNYQNAVVMDSEDDFDHKQLSFAGLAEAMTGIRMQVAADMRIPIVKLFGQSVSAGLGNSAQEEMENYNAMVESQVRNKIKYDLLRIIEIKCQKLFGMIPDDLELKFKPLRTLTAEQEENVKTQKFTRLSAARAAGEITTYEFREGCNKGNLLDITLDNSGDNLNPDDPQVGDLVAEGANNPEDPQDIDDPGAGREDTQKSKLYPKGEYGGKKGEAVKKSEKGVDERVRMENWDEGSHPRADDGTFGAGGAPGPAAGGDKGGSESAPAEQTPEKEHAALVEKWGKYKSKFKASSTATLRKSAEQGSPSAKKELAYREAKQKIRKLELKMASYEYNKKKNDVLVMPRPYTAIERMSRVLANSGAFDRASYEADGGDGWIHPGRRELFENPGNVDEGLWAKAKAASMAAFGKDKWQFVTWWYKKHGGKFH